MLVMGGDKLISLNTDSVRDRIFTIRESQIILDRDLAEFYRVTTKALNQAVKRNENRFPLDFMFRLSKKETDELVTNCDRLQSLKHSSSYPYAFTEQGVAMLSGVLKSETAVKVSIQIINAFVSMRKFISRNMGIFARLDSIERKQSVYDKKLDLVFGALETHKPKQGVFFDGQIFDPYELVSKLIKDAKKNIVLIDNYVDDTVLTLFSKREKDVDVTIYTKEITEQLGLDLKKFNSQYDSIEIREFNKSHDRFMIIDNKDVYHFGASLKDLGKKWFAFSKFDKEALKILSKLKGLE